MNKNKILHLLLSKLDVSSKDSDKIQNIISSVEEFYANKKIELEEFINPKEEELNILIYNKRKFKEIIKLKKHNFICEKEVVPFFEKGIDLKTIKEELKAICLDAITLKRHLIKHEKGELFSSIELRAFDFYSIALKFEGFRDAEKYEFDIEKKKLDSTKIGKVISRSEFVLNLNPSGLLLPREELISFFNKSSEIINFSIKKNKEQKPLLFLEKVFNETAQSIVLSPILIKELETIINSSKKEWWQKAIVASALTISVLKGWDKSKLHLLKQLTEYEDEPLVFQRATVGLSILILQSSKNSKNFRYCLRKLQINSKFENFNVGVYKTLYFLLKTWNISLNNHNKLQDYFKFSYQYFEAIHEKSSYVDFNKSTLNENKTKKLVNKIRKNEFLLNQTQKTQTISLLNTSVSKKRFNKLFYEGKFSKDNVFNKYVFKEYSYKNILDELKLYIMRFQDLNKEVETVINFIAKNENLKVDLFKNFNYHGYINLIEFDFFMKNFNSNNFIEACNLGVILSESQRFHEALIFFERSEQLEDINNEFLMLVKSRVLIRLEREDEALESYNEWIDKFGESETTSLYRGVLFYDIGEYEKAQEEYFNTLRTRPNNIKALNDLGSIQFIRGNHKRALKYYKKALLINTTYKEVLANIIGLLYEIKDYEAAQKYNNNAIYVYPDSSNFWFFKGLIYEALGYFDDAFEVYKKVLQLENNELVKNRKNELLKKIKKVENNSNITKEYIEENRDVLIYFHKKAILLKKAKKFNESLKMYNKAIQIFPNDELIYYGLADLLEKMGQNIKAEKIYKKALQISPSIKVLKPIKLIY